MNTTISDEHKVSLATLFKRLDSTGDGLSCSEVRRRLDQYGTNELRAGKQTPEIVKFLFQFRNFFAILLIIGGLLAFLAEYLDPGQGNLYIAYALVGVVFLNATFTYIQERQSEKILESFRKMLPVLVTVIRDGNKIQVDAKHVVPGDVMLVHEGDRIPADGRILEHNQLKVDLSSLTGESEPQLRHLECTHRNILESRNMVFSGTLVQSGSGKVIIFATGMETQIGKIVQLTKETDVVDSPIRKELRYFIKIISTIAIILGVLFFVVSIVIGKEGLVSLIFAIGIIVANVPEGLLPTVTLALTMASKRMAKKNALIKKLESVESLGSTTVICTDKTGTITQNRISVNTIIINQREYAAWDPRCLEQPGMNHIWQIMSLCNNAILTRDGYSGDPTEGALLVYIDRYDTAGVYKDWVRINEYPFDSATKRMLTVHCHPDNQDNYASLKGAPEIVIARCDKIIINDEVLPLDKTSQESMLDAYQRMARRGERVLALAFREQVDAEVDEHGFVLAGLVGMLDPPRPEVPGAIAKCHRAGIRVIMITGDYGLTAEAIGRQIGLVSRRSIIVRGEELSAMSDEQLTEKLASPEIIFARTSPIQKLRIVKALQAMDEIVTVTGDGVNDAPALKNADMGVSMGIMGTEVAKEASDMVLMDDNFATIVDAVEEGRTIFDNIKKFIAYILTSNVPEILPFIAYVLLDIPLPLTVVLILAIDLGTDILPALGLGMESPETDVMKQPPRPRNERLLSRNLLAMSYGIIGMVQAAAGFFTFFIILFDGGWQWGQELAANDPLYRTAITGFFASIVICQVADVIICRTRRQSLLTVGVFSNHLVLAGITVELSLVALIAYVPALNSFFGTAPLEYWHLLLSVPFAIFILVGDEIRRIFVRSGNELVLEWLTW